MLNAGPTGTLALISKRKASGGADAWIIAWVVMCSDDQL